MDIIAATIGVTIVWGGVSKYLPKVVIKPLVVIGKNTMLILRLHYFRYCTLDVIKERAEMEKKTKEIGYISYCKGIAMICIFLAHAPQAVSWIDNKWTAWGANGVKLLFVISGFLTAKSYLKSDTKIKVFWKKRFWRLAPLYWCAIMFWHIIYVIDDQRMVTSFMTEHDVKAILLNIFLLNGVLVYGNNSVVPGGWYVGAIVGFYLFTPLIIKLVYVVWKKSSMLVRGIPVVIWSVTYIVSWSINHFTFMKQISTVLQIYYSTLFQLPSLLIGILLFLELSENKVIGENNGIIQAVAIILLGSLAYYSTYVNSDYSQIAYGYLSYLFIILISKSYSKIEKSGILVEKLGHVSYEFFLVHLFYTIVIIPCLSEFLIKYINKIAAFGISTLISLIASYFSAIAINYARMKIEARISWI